MFKFITNNWPAKLVCVLIAVILWVYVAIGESKVDNLPGKIPLQLKNIPGDLIPILDVDSVQVKISADRTSWTRLSSNSIEAYVDLNGLGKGTYELDVQARSTVSGVEIVDILPKKVLVRIEPIAKKKVPIKVQTEGQAGEGLVPGDAVIEPESVELSGAESVVDKILEATALIQLNNESAQIEKNVVLVALDSNGEEIKNISFNPSDAKIILPIIKAGTSKTVGIKVKIDGKVKSGYWINQINSVPNEVTVNGNSGLLRNLNFLETKSISVEGLSSSITKTVSLDLPSGVSLLDSNDQIKIEIMISESSSDKEVTAAYIYDNLPSNIKVDSIEPTSIKMIVTGPVDVLNTLNAGNTQIHLNLSGFSGPGNYSIDLNRNMMTVPAGASISSYMPSAVRINLSNK